MYLGIEIGGTKLQLGIGEGDAAELAELVRLDVDPAQGAAGILQQIDNAGRKLLARHEVSAAGIGFGGPVAATAGKVVKSHQVEGWDEIPLAAWCRDKLTLPTALGNDCDVAALAEARFGAGAGRQSVFYVTVGTGVGGGLAIDGKSFGTARPAIAEIGHLRCWPASPRATETVESVASGPGIVRTALALLSGAPLPFRDLAERPVSREADRRDLLARCGGAPRRLTAKSIAAAAAAGNSLALEALAAAHETLGWGIAQVITLTAPEIIVVGGGVSLSGEELFFAPLRRAVARYVFAPLADSYTIVPSALGESAVVFGALALARQSSG